MHTKLIPTLLAAAVLAALLATPSASAAVLTEEGKAVAAGSEVVGKSTGEVNFTGGSPVFCSSAGFTMKLTKNTNGAIEGEIPGGELTFTGTAASSDCTSALGPINMVWNKMCLAVSKGSDILIISGCSGLPNTFTTGLTGTGLCKYSSASFKSEIFTSSDATFPLTEQEVKLEEGGFLCPASQKLDMDFDLTAKSGATLAFS
jgi:hypothetical protein